jgi:MoxR-like ATPase
VSDIVPIALAAPELMTALEFNIAILQPCMVWGPPGIGKSELMAQLAKKLGMELKDVRAMLMNPIDVNGLPHIIMPGTQAAIIAELQRRKDDPTFTVADMITVLKGDSAALDYFGQTVWSRPGVFPRYDESGRGVILFFDEINAAGADVQAALYQPFLDRRIGDHLLDNGVALMAAGNRTNDKGHVSPMPTPLLDRLQHYDMSVSLDAWIDWADDNGVHPLVIAYLQFANKKHDSNAQRCGMLHVFDPKKVSEDRSFPTPRSWSKVSNSIYEMEKRDLIGTMIETATIAGKVGRDAAAELIDFAITFREGLSINAIVLNPDSAKLPTQPAMKCAVISSLARQTTEINVSSLFQYVVRMEEEYQVNFIKMACRFNPKVSTAGTVSRFMRDNAEAFLQQKAAA